MPDQIDTPSRPHTREATHVSRRRVLGTAAWSAPAIVAVTAAPAFATSPASPVLTVSTGHDSTARRPGGASASTGLNIILRLTATNAALQNPVVVFDTSTTPTTSNGFQYTAATVSTGGTTWTVGRSNPIIAGDTSASGQYKTISFTAQTGSIAVNGSIDLALVFAGVGGGSTSDLPMPVRASGSNLGSPVTGTYGMPNGTADSGHTSSTYAGSNAPSGFTYSSALASQYPGFISA